MGLFKTGMITSTYCRMQMLRDVFNVTLLSWNMPHERNVGHESLSVLTAVILKSFAIGFFSEKASDVAEMMSFFGQCNVM